MKAIVFASYIPKMESLAAGTDFLEAFADHFAGYDVFVGINRPSIPQWEARLKSCPNVNLRYGYVEQALTVDSDASAFQEGLRLLKQSGKKYDLIWFGHSKGASSGDRRLRREFVEHFFARREGCEARFADPQVGSFGRYITVTTTPGYTDRTLGKLCEFKYAAINTLFLHTFYILRGSVVHDFLDRCSPDFFSKNLVRDLGFDRYFFERDFPNIADKMGLEPRYERTVSHPPSNKVDSRRIRELLRAWRLKSFGDAGADEEELPDPNQEESMDVARRGVITIAHSKVRTLRRVVGTWRAIRRRGRESPESLLDFAFSPEAALVGPRQIRSEIAALLNRVAALRPENVLEIGTAFGGTLLLWARIAADDAVITSIDLPGGEFGAGYPRWKIPLYKGFRLARQKINLIRADSHLDATYRKYRNIVGERQVDFLFIDGDHTYEGVKRDFELYSPIVRSGGLIAFHDVAVHGPEANCHVDQFWREIKLRYPDSEEFVEAADQGGCGIGVLRVQ